MPASAATAGLFATAAPVNVIGDVVGLGGVTTGVTGTSG